MSTAEGCAAPLAGVSRSYLRVNAATMRDQVFRLSRSFANQSMRFFSSRSNPRSTG